MKGTETIQYNDALEAKVAKALSSMILSVSGFRKVFAPSGDPEDRTVEITQEDALLCTAIGMVFYNHIKPSKVLLASDARPTGPAICNVLGKVLAQLGATVDYAGICSAPEAMAQSQVEPYDMFVYVSASHNPVGHNGIKVGRDGGVFASDVINPVIEDIKASVGDVKALIELYNSSLNRRLSVDPSVKQRCLKDYKAFVNETNFGSNNPSGMFSGIGVVGDLNGSARCVSIDKDFLASLGFKTAFINDEVGKIAHAIVPEGANLKWCSDFLEAKHKKDPAFVLGYVPDNDGDRGNLVYIDEEGASHILKAQDVFALCVYSTLMYHKEKGEQKLAVSVNGPTSMRTDELCGSLGASVFRAEVGEANVVQLGQQLRDKGYCVPILGEGSNGGNITYPAKVRDPMNTIVAVARLIRKEGSVAAALKKIPRYMTTDSFDEEGVVHLQVSDWFKLKVKYMEIFGRQYCKKFESLSKFGIESFLPYQTEGTVERKGLPEKGKAGMKILFRDAASNPVAYIWMRPSGTEPLLRITADVKGTDRELYDLLIRWQRDMVMQAQKELQG